MPVFISGSMQIKNLDMNVKARIENIITSNFNIILGDADGIDSSIQSYLFEKKVKNVVVYCSGPQPRNNVGHWPVRRIESAHSVGSRAFYTAKDLELANDSDYGFMIWDTKSTGTLSNVIELMKRKKKSVVYINKEKEFLNIVSVLDVEKLVTFMNEVSYKKANEKIGLKAKIEALKFEQTSLF